MHTPSPLHLLCVFALLNAVSITPAAPTEALSGTHPSPLFHPKSTYKSEINYCSPNYDDPDGDCIPGAAGQDYPIYAEVPITSFSCRDFPYPGYFADLHSRCQAFHICQSDGRVSSLLCPNGTVFHQQLLVCNWWYNVDCGDSSFHYDVNGEVYTESLRHSHSKPNQFRPSGKSGGPPPFHARPDGYGSRERFPEKSDVQHLGYVSPEKFGAPPLPPPLPIHSGEAGLPYGGYSERTPKYEIAPSYSTTTGPSLALKSIEATRPPGGLTIKNLGQAKSPHEGYTVKSEGYPDRSYETSTNSGYDDYGGPTTKNYGSTPAPLPLYKDPPRRDYGPSRDGPKYGPVSSALSNYDTSSEYFKHSGNHGYKFPASTHSKYQTPGYGTPSIIRSKYVGQSQPAPKYPSTKILTHPVKYSTSTPNSYQNVMFYSTTTPAPNYGSTTPGYRPKTTYQRPTTPDYGPTTSGYGPTTSDYGPTTSDYGPTTSGYGSSTSPSYGPSTPSYGSSSSGYGSTTPDYVSSTPGYGPAKLGGYRASKPRYEPSGLGHKISALRYGPSGHFGPPAPDYESSAPNYGLPSYPPPPAPHYEPPPVPRYGFPVPYYGSLPSKHLDPLQNYGSAELLIPPDAPHPYNAKVQAYTTPSSFPAVHRDYTGFTATSLEYGEPDDSYESTTPGYPREPPKLSGVTVTTPVYDPITSRSFGTIKTVVTSTQAPLTRGRKYSVSSASNSRYRRNRKHAGVAGAKAPEVKSESVKASAPKVDKNGKNLYEIRGDELSSLKATAK